MLPNKGNKKRDIIAFSVIILLAVLLTVITVNQNNKMSESLNDADSWQIAPWEKYEGNPILTSGDYEWESKNVLNPTAIVKDGKIYMLYRAQTEDMTSYIGIAVSEDGYNFKKADKPVLSPTEDYERSGVEDPRIVEIDGTYYMTYTGWTRVTNYLCLATSEDLYNWEKKGKMLPDWPTATKSGAIVPKKINDKYHMYFGDTNMYYATSDDLINWTPRTAPVLEMRFMKKENGERFFDSMLVEPGPTPVITDKGILLIYNGADTWKKYSTGEVLFSLDDPSVVLERTEFSVLEVDHSLEKEGQVNNVVFSEGLVNFKGKWFLYYGMGDSRIGVAVCNAD